MIKQKVKQLIIIGGGASIKEAIQKNLWSLLKNKFTIGLNYSYKYFPNPTFQCFVDKEFYRKNAEELKSLPLIIGKEKRVEPTFPNTILLKSIPTYQKDIKNGVYKASLCGIFALTVAVHLLKEGEIYLLGYDYGETRKGDYRKFMKNSAELDKVMLKDSKKRAITHFYQGNIEHRGIGKINYYNSDKRAERDFGVYKTAKKIKIYNVSKISKIPEDIFEQLSYDEFFKKLNTDTFNQEKLRETIRKDLSNDRTK